MQTVVEDVIKGKAVKTVAREHGVNPMTLKRYVRKVNAGQSTTFTPQHVTTQIFTNADEQTIAECLFLSSKLHYGLSTKTARTLAYDVAIANNITVPPNWNTNKCGSADWLRSFMKRRPELSLRTPKGTTLARATAFNRHTVSQFFNNLCGVQTRHPYPAQNIYKCRRNWTYDGPKTC